MSRLFAIIMTLAAFVGLKQAPAAENWPTQEFQQIIEGQLNAFKSDDEQAAYGYAARGIQNLFPSPQVFMGMVKSQYPQVYRPQSYRFLETLTDSAGRPAQRVIFVGSDGRPSIALYSFERQPDGSWKISGCVIMQAPTGDA